VYKNSILNVFITLRIYFTNVLHTKENTYYPPYAEKYFVLNFSTTLRHRQVIMLSGTE